MSLAATATMVLMLLLLAGFWILQTGLQASLDYTESKVEVVADLKDNVKPSEVDPIIARLDAMPQVKSVEFISEDEALVQWRAHLKEQGEDDLTKYLDANPLHASLNVKLVNASVFAEVVSALRAEEPVVEKVKEQQQLADQVVTVTNVLRTAGTGDPHRDRVHRPVHHRQHDPARRRRRGPRRSRSCGSSARPTRSSAGRSCSKGRWSGCSARR
jgi:cell division transport system permease protein